MSTPSQSQGTPVTDTRQEEVDAHPTTPAPRPPGRSGSGYGVISLCLAAAAFVTAPFLLLIPVAVRSPQRHISDTKTAEKGKGG